MSGNDTISDNLFIVHKTLITFVEKSLVETCPTFNISQQKESGNKHCKDSPSMHRSLKC